MRQDNFEYLGPIAAVSMLFMVGSASWGMEDKMTQVSTPTIHAIEFSGNASIKDVELQERISVKPSGPFYPQQVKFSQDIVMSIYRDQGYADVRVSMRTTVISPGQINIKFRVEEGPLYRFGAILVQGNQFISDKLIRRDLGVASEDPFSQTKIYEGNKQLFFSGYF